jgi:hypothetical protein
MQRVHLVFTANFPDEPIFNEGGDILIPAGRELSNEVANSLNRRGFRCSDIMQRDYYAWEFWFIYTDCKINAVLQRLDNWVLTLTSHFSWKGFILRAPTCSVRAVAELVAQVLKSDLQCEDVTVYSDANCPY